MQNEKFTTHLFFTGGTHHKEAPITGDKLASVITRVCDGPAAVMGIIERALIVDSSDRICIEIKGRDIVFPPALAAQQKAFRTQSK